MKDFTNNIAQAMKNPSALELSDTESDNSEETNFMDESMYQV